MTVIDRLDEAAALVPEWRALAHSVSAQPFGIPDIALSWWRHLGRGELRLVTARNGNGDLIGLAPLCRRRRGAMWIVEWLGTGLGAVGGLLIGDTTADVASAMWSEVLDDERTVLRLVDTERHGRGLDELRRSDTTECIASLHDECPVIDLDGITEIADFLATPERRTIRKKLAKADRAVGDEGFTVTIASAPDAVRSIRSDLMKVYDAAEADRPRLHLAHEPYRSFFDDLLTRCVEQGIVTVLIGSLGDEAVAFDLFVCSGDAGYAILGRMAPAGASISAGHLLTRADVEWGLATGLARLDLQIGANPYKMRWSTSSYDTIKVYAGSPRQVAAGRFTMKVYESAHTLRRRLA